MLIPSQPENPTRRAFHAVDAAACAGYWSSSLEQGLSPEDARGRLERLGENRLPEAPGPGWLARLWAQLAGVTVLALLAAAAIAAGISLVAGQPGESWLSRYGDSMAILAIVVLNAILGLVNEGKAEQALKALRGMIAPIVRLIRGGHTVELAATAVVPGDLVLLEEGDRVAADLRLVEAWDLEVEEAALTGESTPVAKEAAPLLELRTPLAERRNMVFMGTRVTRGRARALVCNTGLHTELGAIAGMLGHVATEPTPLEVQLDRFGRQIVAACVAVCALVFLAGWLIGGQGARQLFLVAVSLAVAAIPEGLPAITTIVLALGSAQMARRHALVRRLPAIETLGCVHVLCTDKTGTLTQNAMTARELWCGGATHDAKDLRGQPDVAQLVHACGHVTGARPLPAAGAGELQFSGDPTDAALLRLAYQGGFSRQPLQTLGEVPFTSARRLASVRVAAGEGATVFVHGAPEVVLERSVSLLEGGVTRALTPQDRQAIAGIIGSWGSRAMRVVALARRDADASTPASSWEEELTFIGLVGIVDPPRPEVKEAVRQARQAGVRTVMITGDHLATASAVASEIGLMGPDDQAVTGADLDDMDDQQLQARVERLAVVARATAAHKLRLIEAFKARGLVCAMTGDGINDAPAIKAAAIGVAMGRSGTEVTKEAADLVLADDNYASLVAAVEQGRAIYANIRKFVFFLLSSNTGIVLAVLVAALCGWPSPLTPLQILWINLITNGLPALALGVDPSDPDHMQQPPRQAGTGLISSSEWLQLFALGGVMALTAIGVFRWSLGTGGGAWADHDPGLIRARTLCFCVLSLGPMFHAFSCRSKRRSIFAVGLFTNRALWGAIGIGFALQGLAVYAAPLRPLFRTAPLGLLDGVVVGVLAILPLVVVEVVKLGQASGRRRARPPRA